MNIIIKSVSVTSDESDFMREFKLSPTRLIREKLWEMKGMIQRIAGEKIERLVIRVNELCKKLEDKDEIIKKLEDVLEKTKDQAQQR